MRSNTFRNIIAPIFCLILTAACSGTPEPVAFYRPIGTTEEVYKRAPQPLQLVVYPGPENPRGAVIFIHGGGWSVSGAGIVSYQDWEEPLRNAGLRSFALEHRVPPAGHGRDQIEDCLDAVAYVRKNAQRFGIPGDKLALVGYSSGGHLATMTGLTLTRPRPGARPDTSVRAVVAFFAPLVPEDLLDERSDPEVRRLLSNYLPRRDALGTLRDEGQALDRETAVRLERNFTERALIDISPVRHLHRRMPPELLIHGTADALVPISQSRKFQAEAERTAPGRVRLREVTGGEHFFNHSRSRWARAEEKAAIEFIVEHLD